MYCVGNQASYHPGMGESRKAAEDASQYWANQLPWVRTVPISRAPKWAIEAAEDAARNYAYEAALDTGRIAQDQSVLDDFEEAMETAAIHAAYLRECAEENVRP